MDNYYEVVVVGAGPAGSTAAYLLTQNNVKTLLIEKEDLPRRKTCGGGLTNKTVRLLERVFDYSPGDLIRERTINFESLDCRVGFGEKTLKSFTISDELYFTDRRDYDYFLFREAETNDLETLIGEGVSTVDFRNNSLSTERGESIEYGHLLAADGVHSPIRKALVEEGHVNGSHWYDLLALGLEAYVPREQAPHHYSDAEWVDLHLGVVNWGYGWVFPHEDELLLGVGGLRTENDDLRRSLMDYGEMLGFDLNGVKIKGHPIPFGNYLKEPYHDNVLLLGDAGGFADPITGEGIFYAQRSGELGAVAYLDQPNGSAGRRYTQLIKNHVLPEMTGAWRLRPLIYGGPRSLRKPIFSAGAQLVHPNAVFDVAHGHRVWHNFTRTGHQLHDTIS